MNPGPSFILQVWAKDVMPREDLHFDPTSASRLPQLISDPEVT
jgi:hypothetical protein